MSAAEVIDVTIEGVLADGTPVKAKCRYWEKDISVEMLSPNRAGTDPAFGGFSAHRAVALYRDGRNLI